jgi:hypothetical protein
VEGAPRRIALEGEAEALVERDRRRRRGEDGQRGAAGVRVGQRGEQQCAADPAAPLRRVDLSADRARPRSRAGRKLSDAPR